MDIGINIKTLRQQMGLSQSELAENINVKRTTVGSWERGRTEPSLKDIKSLCDFFDVDISILTGIPHKNM